MSKRGVHGSPRSGAALAPYKHFAEQYLGAGAIHLPRACQKASGFPSGMAGWEGRGGGDADSGGISDVQAAGRMKGRPLWSPAGGHKGRPYDMGWSAGACGMLPGYRAACLALPEKFVGADAHIGPPRPKPVKNQIRPVPSPSHLRRGRVCASLSGGFL